MNYLDALGAELGRVGITGRLRARILAETADHLTEGDVDRFGDPREIAQRFADELATAQSTRAAFRAFAALAAAGSVFAAGWLLIPFAGGWPDFASAEFVPLGIAAGLAMVVCPQIAFATGLLALLRAWRLRRLATAPAAEVALLLTRTRTALAFGSASMVAIAVDAFESRADLASWYRLSVVPSALVLTVPLVAVAASASRAAALRSAVPGAAGDMFDDFPVRLPRRPWLVCLALAAGVAFVALGVAGSDEGPRNAVAEAVLIVGCFAALGRRLGLRP